MSRPPNQGTIWPAMTKKPPFNQQVPGVERKDGHGIPRRHPGSIDGLKSQPDPSISTLYDIVQFGARVYGKNKCMGSRKLIKTHVEEKKIKKVVDGQETEVPKKWTYYEMSEYSYISFNDYREKVDVIGSGLRALGMTKGDLVHLFAATSSNWLATSHGACSQSMPVVTCYDNLGESGLTHSLVQAGSKAIFLDTPNLPKLVKPLNEATEIKYIIYNTTEPVKQEHIDDLKKTHERLTIVSFEELLELGKKTPVEPVKPNPEDLCCIMYTSGSTGTPKGVPLTHKNVVAAVTGVTVIIHPYIGLGDFFLTFLPLAHILEFVFENAAIVWGGCMGYGNPRTLSDRAMRNCKGDIREFRPTIVVAVPAVWETIKKGVMDQLTKQSPLKQKMFWGAYALKRALLSYGLPGPSVIDSIVFKQVRQATGGRLRVCMNGGGPIAKETQTFISMVICPMIMGYGLTETCAMGCLMDPKEWTDSGVLGTLPGSIEAKLVDFPDAGYFVTNEPEQGEIWIRGDPVSTSYFKNDEETAAAYEDGWFKTGDIGQWDHNGHLAIIDRKKNLVKTATGEYIALEKLESIYRACPLVANICVYADQSQSKPVAIIVPAEPALKKVAEENGIKGDHLEELTNNEKLLSLVHKELLASGKKGGLQPMEMVAGVVMSDEEWTPENGLVTSAQKLNRRGLTEKYKKEIDHAYKNSS